MSYMLRFKDDPINHRGCRTVNPFLYLAEQYNDSAGWWKESPRNAILFKSVDKAVEAARNQHRRSRFKGKDELHVLNEAGRVIRKIQESELNGGTKMVVPSVTHEIPDELEAMTPSVNESPLSPLSLESSESPDFPA